MGYLDRFNRCWQYSSPLLTQFDREKRKRRKQVIVPNRLDSVVMSMFIGDSTIEDEPAAGTVEDCAGRDYNEEFLRAQIPVDDEEELVDEPDNMEELQAELQAAHDEFFSEKR